MLELFLNLFLIISKTVLEHTLSNLNCTYGVISKHMTRTMNIIHSVILAFSYNKGKKDNKNIFSLLFE